MQPASSAIGFCEGPSLLSRESTGRKFSGCPGSNSTSSAKAGGKFPTPNPSTGVIDALFVFIFVVVQMLFDLCLKNDIIN